MKYSSAYDLYLLVIVFFMYDLSSWKLFDVFYFMFVFCLIVIVFYLGGYVDNSVSLMLVDGVKMLEMVSGYCVLVICLVMFFDSSYFVIGFRDVIFFFWSLYRVFIFNFSSLLDFFISLSMFLFFSSSVLGYNLSRYRIEGLMYVFRGYLGEMMCCNVSLDFGIVVFCFNFLDVLFYLMSSGRLMSSFVGVEVYVVCLFYDGVLMVWNKFFYIFSIYIFNGIFVVMK